MTDKPLRLALSGKMSSGKSALAQYLVDRHDFMELCFADKLKQIVKDLFGTDKKDRKLLQLVGEKMRQINSFVWVRYLFDSIPLDRNVIVSDVRYLNEVVTLKNAGFKTIRLEVSEDTQLKRVKKKYGDLPDVAFTHISEVALDGYDGFDYTLDANRSFDHLCQQVESIIKKLRKDSTEAVNG